MIHPGKDNMGIIMTTCLVSQAHSWRHGGFSSMEKGQEESLLTSFKIDFGTIMKIIIGNPELL